MRKGHSGRKGQAAMEFMLTYGWMLLVIVGVISALAYFGVNRINVTPESCIMDPGVSCIDFKVTPESSTIVIINGLSDFEVIGAKIGDCEDSFSGLEAVSGQKQTITLENCDNGKVGNKFKGTIQITRKDSVTGIERVHTGDISSRIQ